MQEKDPKMQQSDLDSEITSEITFLQEKIKERPVNRKKLARRTAITVVMAMVFGLVACVTFLLLEPVINRMLYPEEKAEIVRFPEEEEEVKPEDMAADEEELQIIREEEAGNQDPGGTGQANGEQAGNGPGREDSAGGETDRDDPKTSAGESESNENTSPAGEADRNEGTAGQNTGNAVPNGTDYTGDGAVSEILPEEAAKAVLVENYQEMYDVLGELRREVEKSIVSVTGVTSDVNWINDTLENKGVASGLIVAENGKELLILVGYGGLKDADSISVSFEGEEKEAEVKGIDQTTGLAVLAVPLTAFSAKQKQEITYAALGSSIGQTLVGQPVMAIGSPVGVGGSVSYGIVTSQGTALGLLDSNYKMLTTDIYGSRNASGVLANMRGEIVGILYHDAGTEDMPNRLCGIGISELKKTVEKLSNGEKMVYLGIHGMEINAAVYQKYQLPRGAFVTNIDMDSPAMKAGLQNGDIITKADDVDISSYAEFVNILMRAHPEQNLKLTVARQSQGKGEYQEMTVTVTLQEQKTGGNYEIH